MELTLDAMAYDLWLTIRNGHVVDDDDLDIRQIKFWIKNNRAVWVKNEVGKGYSLSQRFIQPVKTGVYDYVSLIPTDIAQFGTVGDTILKTTIQIPNLIEYKGTPLLTKVGPALVNEGTFTIIPFECVPYIGNGRFNSNAIYAFWKDNYIYLISRGNSLNFTGMRKISIRGIFADPELVPGYLNTDAYPITEALWTYMKDIIMKTDVQMFLATPSDKINESADTTNTQTND